MSQKVAVIGASNNREKFSNKAVRAYLKQGYTVYPVNHKEDSIEGLKAYPSVRDIPDALDRITVYLPPKATLTVLDDIASKGAKELFLNPGSESDEVIDKAKTLGLAPILACSILDIGETPKDY
ncbi:MAG: CoA-binding protein [Candidatus Latescibacteria bacterium]|nr:CoA-binding protein [Candidatus Latescibacterota bacterium]NIO01027.1 CoA-binding protein [Candidatus Latescibacterota bacterium]NIO27426.1 CoA-binding protein [Candidatus Latescibacterota bacterium]NIO54948.1 CoA-binding protein [Candidatus Latescibacterota bacterium]NIT01037.1 CoA-binding protein [Candidatus Latescibacterota bacterium]